MPTVTFARVQQGYRPFTNPRLAGMRGLRGLGAQAMPLALADPNCVAGMPYDVNGNLCPGVDPNCAQLMPYDVNGNPCPGTTPPSTPTPVQPSGTGVPASPSPVTIAPIQAGPSTPAGAPTGSLLLYQATWQVTPTLNVNTIISRVLSAIKAYGLQVTNQATDGGILTQANFNVSFVVQVTGPGFAQPSDAGSIIDHAYYSTVGRMPVQSATVLQSAPGTMPPSNVAGLPTGTMAAAPGTLTSWLEQNAIWIGLGVLAIVAVPRLIR